MTASTIEAQKTPTTTPKLAKEVKSQFGDKRVKPQLGAQHHNHHTFAPRAGVTNKGVVLGLSTSRHTYRRQHSAQATHKGGTIGPP